jgi:hypothetical protein
MDENQEATRHEATEARERRDRLSLPHLTNAERDFWRRAVETERRRQRCGQPAPFPFQPA